MATATNPDNIPTGFDHDDRINVDEITSPIGAQMFDFCEAELFPETLQNSEVDSSSNGCYDEQSSYRANASIAGDMNYNNTGIDNNNLKVPTAGVPSSPPIAAAAGGGDGDDGNTNLSIIFDNPADDQIDNNDISVSIDFTPSPTFSAHQSSYLNNSSSNNNSNQEAFNISSLNNQFSLVGDMMTAPPPLHTAHQYPPPERWSTMPPPPVVPLLGPPLSASYDEDCLPSVPSYLRMRPSQPPCSLIDPGMMAPYLPSTAAAAAMNPSFPADNSGIFSGNGLMLGSDFSHHDLEFQGDSSNIFLSDSMPRVFNCSNDLQALSSESQHLVHGGANAAAPLASEISSLEDPTFKAGKLSVEEKKRKIHRYLKKRNERNFSKKIKYACRKTLADSRPRVRGRFAKNDELGEIARTSGSNHEEDIDEDVMFSNSIPDHQRKVGMKGDDMDSSDIFAHISGVNSFKCNYPIQSWI
ncbi:uncharacterized protein LOC127249313 [Andrographis paniculata]|uniref:uncharacterized protein LOC127249313 n=1 Tax=Andrographis paniculata TaxID=175694 RepID=UPI0021E98564|nr:uncharacterized protein LOC127249313 [Andrographis paniculata]